ncbi:hypothetical protein ABPG74_016670 [Tetrahymena malaccensis]
MKSQNNTTLKQDQLATSQQNEKKQNVQVYIRLRPFLPHEEQEDVVEIKSQENKILIKDSLHLMESKFDQAFDPSQNQKQVFENFKPYLQDILDGYNFTVFAYGQTGSGKTHTMFGADWEYMSGHQAFTGKDLKVQHQSTFFESLESDHNFAGIIPRTIYEVFRQITLKREQNPHMQISVYVSFIQIYNEKIYDLLQDNQKPVALSIHENKQSGMYVEGLSEYQVAHYYDSLQLMRRGEKNRAIRTTSMNVKSSRSHTIFQLQIERIDDSEYQKEKKTIKRSKINLCDLAGSEKINKNEVMGGAHFNELRSINLSLTTLGKVIHSLSSSQKLPIPYRESKLTRILQDSLSGNCQTFIIANISPCSNSLEETLSTLKFAERAQHITLKIKPNEINASDFQIVQKLQREINYLKDLLHMKKKGINPNDIHQRLLKLQEENERLKKTHISINEVEKLIQENRQMKLEITKIQQNTVQSMHGIFDDSKTDKDTLKTLAESKNLLDHDNNLFNKIHNQGDQQSENFFLNTNSSNQITLPPIQIHNNDNIKILFGTSQEKPLSSYNHSVNSYSQRGTFLNSGKHMMRNTTEKKTELPMRIRGKNNEIKNEKGFLEMSNAESIRMEQKRKEKLRILERLNDLERIQKHNQDKLKRELHLLENPNDSENNDNYKSVSTSSTTNIVKASSFHSNRLSQQNTPLRSSSNQLNNPINKQLKKYESNEQKIKMLEKRFLQKL